MNITAFYPISSRNQLFKNLQFSQILIPRPKNPGQPRRRNAKRKAGGRRAGVAPFIKKIFQITNEPRYTSIYWTPKGNSFVINKDTFEVSRK